MHRLSNNFMTYEGPEASTDALARDYKDFVRVAEVGRSRCGEKIRAVIIGKGIKTALLFGAPHPNEPNRNSGLRILD